MPNNFSKIYTISVCSRPVTSYSRNLAAGRGEIKVSNYDNEMRHFFRHAYNGAYGNIGQHDSTSPASIYDRDRHHIGARSIASLAGIGALYQEDAAKRADWRGASVRLALGGGVGYA